MRNVHGHHNGEDQSFFPELSQADPRFDAGLKTLEADHVMLDGVMDQITSLENRVIKLVQLDEVQARREAGQVHGHAERVEAFLDRHLNDEEDLVVPILLHHKMR